MQLCFVYKYTWPDGHIYIGKSTHGVKRFGVLHTYSHNPLVYKYWKKHGEPHKEIVEDNISPCDINSKEIYYISYYNSLHSNNPLGLNLTLGGDGGNTNGLKSVEEKNKIYAKQQETIKQRYSADYFSKRTTQYYESHPETKNKISKSVKQYYQEHNEFYQQAAARCRKNAISGQLWQERIGKYIVRGDKHPNSKSCVCVETQEKFPSCREAGMKTGIPYKNIWACCHGEKNIAYGYHWYFYGDLERQKQFANFIGKPRSTFKTRKA